MPPVCTSTPFKCAVEQASPAFSAGVPSLILRLKLLGYSHSVEIALFRDNLIPRFDFLDRVGVGAFGLLTKP